MRSSSRFSWRAAACTDFSDEKSTGTHAIRLSPSLKRSTIASRRGDGRAIKTTRAPRLTRSAAAADPIAPVAPVTTTFGLSANA